MTEQTNKSIKILVMAGGTGGHVFPALAVAKELQLRGVEIMWLGTRRGLESEVIPAAGINISFVNIAGLRGNGLLGWFVAPIKILRALLQVISSMRQFGPDAVLGLGGFVTGPGGVAAWLLRIPLVIHEQNAIAGLTNKLLLPFATLALQGFPKTFATSKAKHTGNPVRADILNLTERKTASGITNQINLLVVGGSLGAKALNEIVPKTLSNLNKDKHSITYDVWHQTGKKLYNDTKEIYKEANVEAKVDAFIDDMSAAYAWADLVVCRSGALTIAELAAAGVAAILVPYPHAVDDHQTANAKYLSDNGAALLIQQTKLKPAVLAEQLKQLDITTIATMARAAKKLALPDATRVVADYCLEVVNA